MKIPKDWVGKRDAVIVTTKGCVARCTFCHRFEKGYRMRPFEQVIDHIKHLQEKYNVGFLQLFDENFGSNVKLTNDIVSEFGKLNIKWRAGGVRARTVNLEQLKHWKKNGCDYIAYGIESGSQTMLDVMEKNTTTEHNINALKWTYEAGISTNIQLVLAMPGENDKTINETISFLKQCTPFISDGFRLSGNYETSMTYAQALPGTPLYEYYRENGYIGPTLQDEEDYLLYVSDTNASDISHYVNATKQPMLKVLSWRRKIFSEINQHYWEKIHNVKFSTISLLLNLFIGVLRMIFSKVFPAIKNYLTPLEKNIIKKMKLDVKKVDDILISNISPYKLLYYNKIIYKIIMPFYGIYMAFKKGKKTSLALKYIIEYVSFSLKNIFKFSDLDIPQKSLRKVVDKNKVIGDAAPNMNIIREGR